MLLLTQQIIKIKLLEYVILLDSRLILEHSKVSTSHKLHTTWRKKNIKIYLYSVCIQNHKILFIEKQKRKFGEKKRKENSQVLLGAVRI